MSIRITESREGNERVLLQARFNTASGHEAIIAMLKDLNGKGWTMPEVMNTALTLLLDQWNEHNIHPISVKPEYLSSELITLVRQAQELQLKAIEAMNLALSGNLTTERSQQLRDEMASITGAIDINLVEGAGSYAGKATVNDDNDDGWEWE